VSEILVGPVLLLVPALLALGIPRVIAALPEPPPDPDPDGPVDEARAADPPKEPWVDLAARPGLAWRCASASALVGALVWWGLGASWAVLPWLALVPAGVMLAVVDWRTRLLPTRLVWSTYGVVAVLVVAASLATGDPGAILRAGIGSLVAFAVFFVLWFVSPRSLGYGDVRLAALLGLALGHLGVGETALGLYAGFLVGGLTGVGLRLTGRLAPKQHIPFGPFMLVGAIVGLLWGGSLWESIYT
jgi:leader peptidase (prepilin peptidase) / N-methyltransferase